MKEIYIGNLRFDMALNDVRALFAPFGEIYSIDLHTERTPEKPHAYAFVEMAAEAADAAVAALDGMEYYGLTLKVEMAMMLES